VQQDIYVGLPAPARALVDEIEAHTGIEITVLAKSERGDGWVSEAKDESVVGVITGPQSIVIESPTDIRDITDENYIHELLHLHRMYIVNVPHLYPRKTSNGNAAAAIDNWLEHIVIYERQMELCPDFYQKMNAELIEFWRRCPWNTSGSDLKFNLLSRYMITHRYGSPEAKKAMADAIQAIGLPFSVRNVARQCSKAIVDKHRLVASVLQFCEVPTDLFWLRRYDVKNQKAVWFPI